jgi:cytoskeletal protein CcmA (bactofilin family)
MPGAPLERAPVTCQHCGHTQLEPVAVITTVCRSCRRAIHVREDARTPRKATKRALPTLTAAKPAVELRELQCFTCNTRLSVPVSAESTMCKRCSSHIDLRDYVINQAVSKNFRTHGRFEVKPRGYVFNTDSIVGEAVLRGRFHGKLHAKHRLEIYTGAEIKGSFQTGLLVVPQGQVFTWPQVIKVDSAEIAGELDATLEVSGVVSVKSSGRLFGDVRARNLSVEHGAVIVGHMGIIPDGATNVADPK